MGEGDMYSDVLNVALIQYAAVWEDASASLAELDTVLEKFFSNEMYQKPDLVVLPEFFAVGFSMNPAVAEDVRNSKTLDWLKSVSRRYMCAIAGSVPVLEEGKRYNRMYFVTTADNAETDVKYYDKGHLFFGGENDNFTAGVERQVFELKGWRIMPGICFDLRFPEWCRNFPDNPYDIYLNVANWPVARQAAAEALLKARSIENVCWSLFCNRCGNDALLEYNGGSSVIDYRGRRKGRIVNVCGTEIVYAHLEKEPMLRFRQGFPILDLLK